MLVAATSAPGKDAPPVAPYRLHLDARLGLGGVGVADGHDSPIASGATLPFGLSAGVTLTRSLVLFADVSDDHMLLFTSPNSYDATWFDLYGAGLGLKVYLTPRFFLAGSGAVSRLRLQHHDSGTENSGWGPVARLSVGAEWPVSPQWSVGIGGEYLYGRVHSRGLDPGLNDPLETR